MQLSSPSYENIPPSGRKRDEEIMKRWFQIIRASNDTNGIVPMDFMPSVEPIARKYPELFTHIINDLAKRWTQRNSHHAVRMAISFLLSLAQMSTELCAIVKSHESNIEQVWLKYKDYNKSSQWNAIAKLANTILYVLKELPSALSPKAIQSVHDLAIKMRKLPSVCIIGAGFSYDGILTKKELGPMVCSALDKIGIEEPRELYDNEEEKCWSLIRQDPQEFQRLFSHHCHYSTPSEQHYAIAKLFHEGCIKQIVSLNWDNHIERAFKELYDEDINKITENGIQSDGALWKLHGDVDNPTKPWILPFDKGRVFESLIESLRGAPTHFLIIIGYRESEMEVKKKLIEPMEKKAQEYIFRFRRQSDGPNFTQVDARTLFKILSKELDI